jgi:hypothetical protein
LDGPKGKPGPLLAQLNMLIGFHSNPFSLAELPYYFLLFVVFYIIGCFSN